VKIKIDTQANVVAVYNDKLPALALGPMEVKRASNVEFNHDAQEWEARTPAGELIARGTNRDAVIKEEVRVIESRL
jgi:hypothetical protein